MIQAGINKIAVRLNEFYTSELGSEEFKVKILVSNDDDMMKTKYIKTGGEIVGLPLSVKEVEHSIYEDVIINFDNFYEKLKQCDHVYFDYKALDEDEYIEDAEGNKVYFVDIINIFCGTIENEDTQRVYPNTNITLCKPFYGFGYEEIQLPDGTTVRGKESKSTGIIYDTNPPPHERIAIVAHPDMESSLGKGDIVMREPKTNYEYDIAGESFYVVPTDLILGTFTGDNFENHTVDDVRNEYQYDIDATESFDDLWGEEIEKSKDSFRNKNQHFTS